MNGVEDNSKFLKKQQQKIESLLFL